jgi:glyoxylase-like metal-dependent hydrolase (beta-lactamase superfamily II)
VLTHFHEDPAGGAAEPAALTGAEVLVHTAEAVVVRGEVPGPEPVLEDWSVLCTPPPCDSCPKGTSNVRSTSPS